MTQIHTIYKYSISISQKEIEYNQTSVPNFGSKYNVEL